MSHSEKRKQKKSPAPHGAAQPAAGGQLRQIAAGKHPTLKKGEADMNNIFTSLVLLLWCFS